MTVNNIYSITVHFHKLIEDSDHRKSIRFEVEKIIQFLAQNHLRRQDISLHCISIASARAKGQGLLGHCPEAKTYFTVSNLSNRDPNSAHHERSV